MTRINFEKYQIANMKANWNDLTLAPHYDMVEGIHYEVENWEMGLGYLHEEPYFDAVYGFYHFIRTNDIPWLQHGYRRVGVFGGRLVAFYGFNILE